MSTLFAYDLRADGTTDRDDWLNHDFYSSAVRTIAYNRKAKELFIEFVSGGAYVYGDVEESTYLFLLGSKSLGRFYSNHIQGNFDRVPTEKPIYLIAPVLDEPVKEEVDEGNDYLTTGAGALPTEAEGGFLFSQISPLIADVVDLKPEQKWLTGDLELEGTNNVLDSVELESSRYGITYRITKNDSDYSNIDRDLLAPRYEPVFNALSEADALAQFEHAVAGMNVITGWNLNIVIEKVTHYLD